MNDDYDPTEIECGHCGTHFSYELLRCPNCGSRVYEPEVDEESKTKSNSEIPLGAATRLVVKELFSKALVIVWGLVSIAIAILIYIGLRPVFHNATKILALIIIYVCAGCGALIGGFIAGRFSNRRISWDGLVVGLLSLGGALALLAHEFFDLKVAFLSWVTPFGWALVLSAGWAGAYIANRSKNEIMPEPTSEKQTYTAESEEYGLYYELLLKVNFDTEVAERLIEDEGRQRPMASRVDWIESAIQGWERDKRG
jgi:DNA-directed RNA polymerase subunit RPC12/RpoP